MATEKKKERDSKKTTRLAQSRDKKKENLEQKKKVEEELEAESSEEEEDVKITRVGYLSQVKLKKKEWKAMYCVLIGGSFYYYKNSSDAEPKGKVDLKGLSVVVVAAPAKGEKKKYSWTLSKGDEILFTASCSSELELAAWTKSISENLNLEPADPPQTAGKTKKAGVIRRAKGNVASKTASSVLGKKVMKAIVNEETTTLLNALKSIVKSESGSQKKAEDLEKNILKIAIKSFLLIENKILTADDFLIADKPLREAFELMVKVFNGRGRVRDDKVTEALSKVENLLKKAEEVITNLLAPNLTSKNMLRISAAFGCIANEKFLNTVFRDDSLEVDLDKLIDAMEYYTQFHYH